MSDLKIDLMIDLPLTAESAITLAGMCLLGSDVAGVHTAAVAGLLLAVSEASRKQAQAPLLEALREAERCLIYLPTSWGADSELEKIRAAIAQAEEERE